MNQLGMFAKYWEAGQVKTRLASSIGPEAASAIYRASLQLLLTRFREFRGRRVLAYWPTERESAFAELVGDDWQLQPQSAGDLGQRMQDYFTSAFQSGAERVILIGSDSPTMPAHVLDEALEVLDDHTVALGPCDDGGYYLVAGRDDMPNIFSGISWSTRDVWSHTVDRLNSSGCRWHKLPQWHDIDYVEDLDRVLAELDNDQLDSEPPWDAFKKAIQQALSG